MSNPPAHTPQPAGDDRNLVQVDETYIAPGLEDKLRLFWEKNAKGVITACVLIALAIAGKGIYEVIESKKEASLAADYAAAGTSEKLKAFAAANDGQKLAGVAQVRLADEAYTAGKFSEAQGLYEKAAAVLKTSPLGNRAKLGAAVSKLQAGKGAEAEAALKQIAADTTQLKAIRAEATYLLATLAAEAGKADEAGKLADQVLSLDPAGSWAQRSMMLRATLPVAPAAAAKTDAAPGVSFSPKP